MSPTRVFLPLAIGSITLLAAGCSRLEEGGTGQVTGRTMVTDSLTGGIEQAMLQSMQWQDVEPTLEACARGGLAEQVLAATSEISRGPCVYLRGLLQMSAGRLEQARHEWAKLDIASVPPDYLYAPWRLAMAGTQENPYAAPLEEAVRAGRTGALVAARWYAAHAEWASSQQAYLITDPAGWTPYDAEMFRRMRLNGSAAADTSRVLAGALAGGRVPKALRATLAGLIKEGAGVDPAALKDALQNDPVFAKAAVEAASRQLALRQAFASSRFDLVMEKVRGVEPSEAADETVLLAFLASCKTKQHEAEASRWEQELRRRKPGTETAAWIASLQPPPR